MTTTVVRWLGADGSVQQGDESSLDAAVSAAPWVWVDVTSPSAEALGSLAERFGLHPLAVEDVLHSQRRAKVDMYPGSLFISWLTPYRRQGDGIASREIDVFLAEKFLITLHPHENPSVSAVAAQAERTLQGGPDWTLHAIVDQLVDSTLSLVDSIGEELNALEDRMLNNPRQEDLVSLHSVKRRLVRLHRIVSPERDVVRAIGRERNVVSEDAYRYFADVGDHLARVQDSIETYQDVASSVMDLYLSAQNNRMNQIMKQLTVVATIFMPLTLLSGIYGMNVVLGMWPPINRVWSFPAVVGSMLVIAASMAAYFRKKNWW
jgi:magnesium transporter